MGLIEHSILPLPNTEKKGGQIPKDIKHYVTSRSKKQNKALKSSRKHPFTRIHSLLGLARAGREIEARQGTQSSKHLKNKPRQSEEKKTVELRASWKQPII